MGDGRDGLPEAVHLAAEKRALVKQVEDWTRRFMQEKEAFAAEHAEVERLRNVEDEQNEELERLRDALHEQREGEKRDRIAHAAEVERLRATARENKWYAEKHGEQATTAEAEVERLRADHELDLDLLNRRQAEVERLREELQAMRDLDNPYIGENSLIGRNEALNAEVERLREDKQRLEAEKRVMLFPSIKKWHERADAAEAEVERLRAESEYNFREAEKVPGLLAEVERLTMDVEGTHRENERLRAERDSSASNWGKERELRAEVVRLRDEVERLRAALYAIESASPQSYDWYQSKARRALEGSE